MLSTKKYIDKKQTPEIKRTFKILQYSTLQSTVVAGQTAGIQGLVHVLTSLQTLESLQLKGLHIGDLLYMINTVSEI